MSRRYFGLDAVAISVVEVPARGWKLLVHSVLVDVVVHRGVAVGSPAGAQR